MLSRRSFVTALAGIPFIGGIFASKKPETKAVALPMRQLRRDGPIPSLHQIRGTVTTGEDGMPYTMRLEMKVNDNWVEMNALPCL